MSDYLKQRLTQSRGASSTTRVANPTRPEGSPKVKVDATGAAVYGVADTVTFGYLDELGAVADRVFLGKNYEQALAENRAKIASVRDGEHGGAYLGGQLGGALVGGLGALKAFKGAGAVKIGMAEGALYGTGSTDGDFMQRLGGGITGGAIGAAGGWALGSVIVPGAKWGLSKTVSLVRHGRTPRLTTKITPTVRPTEGLDDLTALRKEINTGQTAAQRAPKVNAITGQTDDVIEDGALFSMRELLGDPGAARAAMNKRLGKMSAIEAQRLAERIEKATLDGDQIDDPHFRSLLGFDVQDADIDGDTVLKAISILEEGIDDVLRKAGGATRTVRSMEQEANAQLKEGVLLQDLDEALKRSRQSISDSRISQHVEMYAGVSFVRAKDKYLPQIKAGVEGARESLAEALTKSAHFAAIARTIGGNHARALRIRQESGMAGLAKIDDDVFEVESIEQIRARVDSALKELGDDDLTDLMGRLKSAADIQKVEEVITDAAAAKAWTGYRRTMNSVSGWLRSNALTPATGLFNTISFIGHDFFRNGLAKKWAANGMRREGRLDDAMALDFERSVGRAVYWEAHRRGLHAMVKRVQWEGWRSIEKIAGTARGANSTLAAKARLKQSTMLTKGFKAPDLREYKPKPGIGVTDTAAFDARMATMGAQRAGVVGGSFARLVNAAERAGAATLTAVDELGNASMKLFTGAVDDYGRQFVTLKETYAQSARFAIKEAMENSSDFGSQQEMLAWAQKRAQELAEMPPADIHRKVEAKLLQDGNLDGADDLAFFMKREKAVELEADRTLLMDGPQTSHGRTAAAHMRTLDKWAGLGQVEGALMPYINTPVRIFERGLVSYNKRFAMQCEETLDILKKGGVEAELEMARIEMGTMAIKLGALLGGTGALTLTNGGFENSANLDAGPPNRINFPGGGYVEIGRLDPFALMLSMGAMLGQSVNAGYHAYARHKDVDDGIHAFIQTAFFAAKDAVLEKSYLTGLQDMMEIVMARDEGGSEKKLAKHLQGIIGRLVPLGGTNKQLTETLRDSAVESIGFGDAILRSLPGGALFMAPKIDALGDEVKSREMGIAIGNSNETEDRDISPVKAKLRELGIDIRNVSKTDGGIALSAEQVSELRRIRGKEALNDNGETMEEALAALFEDPEFNAGATEDQHDAVVDVMNDFNDAAKALLEERNPKYLSNREANRGFREYLKEGLYADDARERAREDVLQQGLPASDL